MLPKPDVKELNKVLTEVVELLVKKGFLPATVDKKALVRNVAEKIMQNPDVMLNTQDLRKESTLKGLGFACVAEQTMGNQVDYTLVFKHQSMLQEKDLALTFKSMFDELLKLKLKDLKKSPEEIKLMQKKLDQFAMKLATTVFQNVNKREMAFENKAICNTLNALIDPLSEGRRALYNVDTHVTGAEFKPTLSVPYGDQMGVQDLAPDYSGGSFMAQKDNPIGPDPLGTKNDNLVSAVVSGAAIIDSPLEKQIMDAISPQGNESHYNPNPFATKPKPPGTVDAG